MGGGRITSALSTMKTAMFNSGGSFWGYILHNIKYRHHIDFIITLIMNILFYF